MSLLTGRSLMDTGAKEHFVSFCGMHLIPARSHGPET
jgi:hypothetical protein